MSTNNIRIPYKILFRDSFGEKDELDICKEKCDTTNSRVDCSNVEYVIGRYSVLPYYLELQTDLNKLDSTLINSYNQHKWIADFSWYNILSDYTFKTWFSLREVNQNIHEAPFVIKGCTNSKKFNWRTHMFANNYDEVISIYKRLCCDELIGRQSIVFRKYEPLVYYETLLDGLQVADEYRFFYLGNNLLSCGFYWSIAENIITKVPLACKEFAQSIANIVKNYVNFFVLDIAQKANGEWVLVEINDGQMSSVSECNINELYENLHQLMISKNWLS